MSLRLSGFQVDLCRQKEKDALEGQWEQGHRQKHVLGIQPRVASLTSPEEEPRDKKGLVSEGNGFRLGGW